MYIVSGLIFFFFFFFTTGVGNQIGYVKKMILLIINDKI